MLLEPGTTLSHFRIVARIGAGGMGVVYKAVDQRLNRPVAIKVLPPELMADPERRRRFRREARTEAALNHPNIAAVHEVDESEGVVFLVMEHVEGATLRALLAGRPLPIREAVRIGAEIAEGLAWAHDRRVIHRDLKPENVMVRPDGHVKILDFGLAKLLAGPGPAASSLPSSASTQTADLTGEGRVLGTVDYMSPEQARGQALDHRSDIFSFGIVLYEMVAGRTPFASSTPMDTLSAILEREAAPASSWNPGVPEELERLLRRCLGKRAADRYDSALDLKADLLALAADAPAPASARWSRRHRAAGVAVVAGALVLAALLTWGGVRERLFRGSPESGFQSLAVLPFENAGGDPDAAYLSDGIADTLIRNLTQLPQLTVMARSTVEQLRGRDPREVGRMLPVRAVLTGRVQQRGAQLVIRAELVDARTGTQLWGEQYQRDAGEMQAIESDVAREIVQGLRLKLTPEESRLISKRPTKDAEAYRLYLKGRWYVNQYEPAAMGKAIALFQEALQRDPSFALAHAGLADGYYGLTNTVLPPSEAVPKARAAALAALELDPDLAEARVTLAFVKFAYDWEWRTAESEFRRAIELNPGYAAAHQSLSMFLTCDGRPTKAVTEARRAVELDPLSVGAAWSLALPYYNALRGERQYERAITEARRIIRVHPDFSSAHHFLGQVYAAVGRHAEALEEMGKAVAMVDTDTTGYVLAVHAWGYAAAGETNRTREMLANLEERIAAGQQIPSSYIAEIYTALGETDGAFTWLERALANRDEELVFVKVNPRLDPLRDDPRFADLLRRMNLER